MIDKIWFFTLIACFVLSYILWAFELSARNRFLLILKGNNLDLWKSIYSSKNNYSIESLMAKGILNNLADTSVLSALKHWYNIRMITLIIYLVYIILLFLFGAASIFFSLRQKAFLISIPIAAFAIFILIRAIYKIRFLRKLGRKINHYSTKYENNY